MLKAKQLTSIKNSTTITNSLEEKLGELAGTIDKQDQSLYRVECALDETQQYLRRDCLEINGVPISSYENPNQLVKQVGSLAGVEIDDRHIAAAHKLPDSKNVKNRLIVKFIQRDKMEKLYKNRKNLVGKNLSHLPSIDLVTVFDAILTSRQTSEKLQCLYENLMSNNFRRTAVLKKKYMNCKLKLTTEKIEGVARARRPRTTF